VNKHQLTILFQKHQHLIDQAVFSKQINITGVTLDDVYQEVSIRVIKLLDSDREIENLSSYIYRITANVIVDLARANNRHAQETQLPEHRDESDSYHPELDGDVPQPDNKLADKELQKALLTAIEALPEDRRVAVKMRLQGYTVKEMMALTGWSYYKAENLSKRSMAALKEQLEKMDIHYEIN
jgi:RNA polymerase sigma factor (sigma-70 family)